MNIPKEAIEKAIEGGWKSRSRDDVYLADFVMGGWSFNHKDTVPLHAFYMLYSEIALDPTFWQSLQVAIYDPHKTSQVHWRTLALQFCRLILTGQSTDDFWKEILSTKADLPAKK